MDVCSTKLFSSIVQKSVITTFISQNRMPYFKSLKNETANVLNGIHVLEKNGMRFVLMFICLAFFLTTVLTTVNESW